MWVMMDSVMPMCDQALSQEPGVPIHLSNSYSGHASVATTRGYLHARSYQSSAQFFKDDGVVVMLAVIRRENT